MKIKVCGITQMDQLAQLDELGIDYAGLIFAESSPRYILDKLKADELKKADLKIQKVGVFVDAKTEDVISKIEEYHLDAVQLHGEESPEYCKKIKEYAKVIKAFRIGDSHHNDLDLILRPYEAFCDYYLFDTYSQEAHGGTGKKFDWSILKENKIGKYFFLSGGIGLDNVDEVKLFKHPFLYGTDVNSTMETEPGVKDIGRVRQFKTELEQQN